VFLKSVAGMLISVACCTFVAFASDHVKAKRREKAAK